MSDVGYVEPRIQNKYTDFFITVFVFLHKKNYICKNKSSKRYGKTKISC